MNVSIDGQVYPYDPGEMLNTEAIALQKVTGLTVPRWLAALEEFDALALTALVWLIWRREGREVAFSDVEFSVAGLKIEDDEESDPDPEPGPEPGPEQVGPTEPVIVAEDAPVPT